MYVKCIGKPSRTEFTCTNVTVGKTYPVKWINNDDYLITDDKEELRYYRQRFFKETDWQGEFKK
jgi:hypothetical protein